MLNEKKCNSSFSLLSDIGCNQGLRENPLFISVKCENVIGKIRKMCKISVLQIFSLCSKSLHPLGNFVGFNTLRVLVITIYIGFAMGVEKYENYEENFRKLL